RELVHVSEWRVESRERDEKLRVKSSSHTLHHDARRLRETVAKIGTDMPLPLSGSGRLLLMPIRAELRDEHGTPIRGLDVPPVGRSTTPATSIACCRPTSICVGYCSTSIRTAIRSSTPFKCRPFSTTSIGSWPQ